MFAVCLNFDNVDCLKGCKRHLVEWSESVNQTDWEPQLNYATTGFKRYNFDDDDDDNISNNQGKPLFGNQFSMT